MTDPKYTGTAVLVPLWTVNLAPLVAGPRDHCLVRSPELTTVLNLTLTMLASISEGCQTYRMSGKCELLIGVRRDQITSKERKVVSRAIVLHPDSHWNHLESFRNT